MRLPFSNILSFLAGGALIVALLLTGSTVMATPTVVQLRSIQPAELGNVANADAGAATSHIHYQGRLLNPVTGQPKPDGAYTMVFNLYASESGGTSLWTESKNVLANKGLFSTLLGDTTPFPAGLFNGDIRYLGIAVGGDPEAVPRQEIASVAYAIFAATAGEADMVDGKNAADFAAASHTHTGADLADNTVTSAKITDGSVNSADIADGSISSADIADGSVNSADIADGSVSAADIADGSVSSADIADYSRTVAFPANVLSHTPTDTDIQPTFAGLRWKNVSDGAFLILPRPADWDGSSDVTFRFFFYPESAASGNVQFFMRPRVYNVGDTFLDTAGILSTVASVGLAGQYNELQVTIPATRFGSKAWWYLVIQRNSSVAGAYLDDVTVMSVAMTYTAVR